MVYHPCSPSQKKNIWWVEPIFGQALILWDMWNSIPSHVFFFPCSLFISLSNGVYYGILDVYHVPVAILVPLAKYPVHLFIRGNWVRGNWVREVCYCCQYWFARWEIHIPSIAKTNRLNLFGSECHLHSLYQTKPFLSQQQINEICLIVFLCFSWLHKIRISDGSDAVTQTLQDAQHLELLVSLYVFLVY